MIIKFRVDPHYGYYDFDLIPIKMYNKLFENEFLPSSHFITHEPLGIDLYYVNTEEYIKSNNFNRVIESFITIYLKSIRYKLSTISNLMYFVVSLKLIDFCRIFIL